MSTSNDAQKEDPGDFFWQTYLDASKAEDEARPKNWEGSTTGILTFTGLFAATVAAFIVESYKLLSPDSGDRTNVLLEHMIIAMANASSQNPVAAPPPELFSVSSSSIVTNVCWFSSLLIALICALLSTLVQEWSRNYVQDINRRKVLHESLQERAFNHIYIRMGVNRYGMDQFVSWIVALVHLSVFLFACGLLVFLFAINGIVAGVSTVVLGSFIVIYCVASLVPLLHKSCPYRTPISYMMASICWLALQCRSILQRICSGYSLETRNFQDLITRQNTTGGYQKFLTDPRFQFAWERTYVHINFANQSAFFRSLLSIISLHENRTVLLNRMCADDELMYTLCQFLRDSYQGMHREPSSSLIDAEIFELIAQLSERMFALEVEHYHEHRDDRLARANCGLLHAIGNVSRIAEVDGPSQLSARLCLVRVRWSLIELCVFEVRMEALHEYDLSRIFRRPTYEFRVGSREPGPTAVLLLLTTGSYTGYYNGWEHTGASNLLPLHENDRYYEHPSRAPNPADALAHVAACNALTAVSHLLEASQAQRIHALNFAFDAAGSLMVMSSNSKQKPASSKFVSVLRSAGLDEWLEPGSTFRTEPRDGPNHDFLSFDPGSECVEILRKLARHVDFEAHFDRPRLQRSNPLAAFSIPPHNVADTGTRSLATLSQLSSSNAMEDEPESPPNERSAFLTVAQKPSDNPPSPLPQNGPPAPASVSPSRVANSLPAPETSSAVEILYEDVRGVSRDGAPADATGDSLSFSPNATGTIPTTPNGHKYDTLSSEQDRVTDTATAEGASAEAQHKERVADVVEEAATTSTPLGIDGQEHQAVSPLESPGLRSVRVDDDRTSREGIVQDSVEMAVIAIKPGSSSADVAGSEQARAV